MNPFANQRGGVLFYFFFDDKNVNFLIAYKLFYCYHKL